MNFYSIELENLPKISLNEWYSGNHWSKRTKIKDTYKILVKNQFKIVLKKDKVYQCKYSFFFKNKPLDASNCVAMVKLIEDIIFESDKYDIVERIQITSSKADDKKDSVLISINEFNKDIAG